MLFLLHRGNHPDLTYRGGQRPILHLSAPVDAVIKWATDVGQRWAFSFSNAGARYARFSAAPGELDLLDWTAIGATDFRPPPVREAKQSEFLVHGGLPLTLVDQVGAIDAQMVQVARDAFAAGSHCPTVQIRKNWYY